MSPDRVDGAKRIRDMADGDDLRALRQQLRERLEIDLAELVDRRDAQRGAGLLAEDLPRHDVRVVLQPRQQHLVAGLQRHPAVGLRDQVDAVGRARRQDDRTVIRRVDEARGLDARAFVELRRALAQQVGGAMDVRVGVPIVVVHRANHRFRLLAGVRAVEIHQRLAVHELAQNREVGPDLRDIERHRREGSSCCDRQDLYPIA